MKLIDILNLIAKGELEEGVEMRIGCVSFFYRNGILENGKGYPLFTSSYLSKSALLQEVEIISEDTNVVTKIEELGYKRYETEDYFEWRKDGITIDFDLQNETVAKYDMRDDAYECITMAELKAINKKCQELGWE